MFLPIVLGLALFYSKLDPQKEEKKEKKEKKAAEEEEKEEEWEELQDLSTTGSSETDEDTTLLELPGEENMWRVFVKFLASTSIQCDYVLVLIMNIQEWPDHVKWIT